MAGRELAKGAHSKADAVYGDLKEAILSGALQPGSLIDKSGLCERLGVSRFPVSAAVSRLAYDRLVDVAPQHGSFVARISLEDARERLFIRGALEGEIAAEAARRMTPAGKDALAANLKQEDAAVAAQDHAAYLRARRYVPPDPDRLSGDGPRRRCPRLAARPSGTGAQADHVSARTASRLARRTPGDRGRDCGRGPGCGARSDAAAPRHHRRAARVPRNPAAGTFFAASRSRTVDNSHDQSSRPAPRPFRQRDHRHRRDFGRRRAGAGRQGARARAQGSQDGGRSGRDRRADPQIRPDHRFRLPPDWPWRVGARAQLRSSRIRARLPLRRGHAPREHRAGGRAADLPGLPPRQRQGRDAQLSRGPNFGELLGDGRALDRQGGRALRNSRRLSACRRNHRAGPWHGLRHGRERRGVRGAHAHPMGLRRQSQHRRGA